MDPLFAKLAAPLRRRRFIGGAIVVAGVAVLGIAVLVSATTSGGSTVQYSGAPTGATSSAAAAPTPVPTPLLVHVTGAVRHPGLVSVPQGARAVDAITAAGGPAPDADESAVNLAARVVDGQQLLLPKRGATASAAPATGATASTTAPISLSTATEAQLETLPRIGPAMAARIIAWRTAHGAFSSVSDLQQVSGIGAKTLAGLSGLVTP